MIVVRIWEGLGNQMFQYAYARLLKERTGKDVCLEGRRIYRESLPQEDLSVERKCGIYHYNLSLRFIKPEYLAGWSWLAGKNIYQRLRYRLAQRGVGKYLFLTDADDIFSYQERFLNVRDHTYVMGHFLNRKYFEPVRDILLREFSLKKRPALPPDIEKVLGNEETVSIHIRRGDYLYAECAQVISKEMRQGKYYERAVRYMAEKISHPVILFFSDDIEWVKENFPCVYKHFYISDMGLEDYEELMIMSECKNNIIANSTFSFWAGWLNQNKNKIVIAPKHWMPSIVPKDWVQI